MFYVKQKWFSIKNVRRTKSLWDECAQFNQYTDGVEFIEFGHKLDNFLDAFLTAKEELQKEKSTKLQIDSNYGDCTDILLTLVQIVEREVEKYSINNNEDSYLLTPELINKIFLVVDIILQADKYQQLVKNLPSFIDKIISFLYSLNNDQNKILILQIIRTLGSNADMKVEIIKLDSFRKIIFLLQTNDEKLIKEILLTLKSFLKDDNYNPKPQPPPSSSNPNSHLVHPPRGGVLNNNNNQNTVTSQHEGTPHTSYWNPFHSENALWKRKIFSRFFGQLRFFSKGAPTSEGGIETSNDNLPLTSKEILEEIEKLNEFIELKKLSKQNYSQHLKEIDEITKNFISSPEMLGYLLNSLKYSDIQTQLEFFEIICNLLFSNFEIQLEFKKIDGYYFFRDLIENICDGSEESRKILKKIFRIISVVVEDGNIDKRVGNHDAFLFLFQLLNITSNIQPKLQALHTIHHLLYENRFNVVDILYVGGIEILFQILRETTELMYTPNHDEDKLQFAFAVNDLIDYIASISISRISDYILKTYIEIVDGDHQDHIITDTVKFIVYHSLVKLSSNILYYHKPLPSFLYDQMIILLDRHMKIINDDSSKTSSENLFEMDEDYKSEGELADDLPLRFASSPIPAPWVDQTLLILELFGLLVTNMPLCDNYRIEQFIRLVIDKLPIEVTEISLWIIQQIILQSRISSPQLSPSSSPSSSPPSSSSFHFTSIDDISNNNNNRQRYAQIRGHQYPQLPHLIDMLDQPYLSSLIKEKVCYAIAELIRTSDHYITQVQCAFQQAGGITKLLDILEENENPSFCYSIFYALGEVTKQCEQNKMFIEDEIGFPELLRIIKSSSLTMDLVCFRLLLEMITTKATLLSDIIIERNFDDEENKLRRKYINPNVYSSKVSSIIDNIKNPQCYRRIYPRIRTLKSSLSSPTSPILPDLQNSSNISMSSSPLPASLTCSYSIIEYDLLSDDYSLTSSTASSSSSSYNNSSNNNFNSNGGNNPLSNTNSGGVSSGSGGGNNKYLMPKTYSSESLIDVDNENVKNETELLSDAAAISKEFTFSTFRNSDAVIILMELLRSSSTPTETQISVLFILSQLLQSNPNNEKIFSSVKTINDLINLATQSPNHQIRSSFFQLASLIGKYNMNISSSISLFNLAADKEFETFQLDILQLIYNIVKRKSPDSYFYLDGYSGMFQINLLDRFPSAKSGYTFSCWIKIQNFLYDEIGLFSWQNQHQHTIFEIYFKKFIVEDESVKYYLSIQTQNHPMPLEDLSFDSFSFSELTDSWHHITITHVQQDITLYIDGELIQRCSSFNYPRTVTKDRALTGKIGCRIYGKPPHLKKGFLSGKLGAIHFVQSVLSDEVIQRIFISGSLQDIPLNKVGVKNKEFLIIDPISFENYQDLSSEDEGTLPLGSLDLGTDGSSGSGYGSPFSHSSFSSTTSSSSYTSFSSELDDYPVCISPSSSPIEYTPHHRSHRVGYKVGNPVGGMYLFHTMSLISIANEIKAMEKCFYFISKSETEIQSLALKILTLLIQKNNDNMKEFKEKLRGFDVLYYVLVKSQPLHFHSLENSNSYEVFEILFNLLSDGQIIHPKKRFIFTHQECFLLILDYLIFCNHHYQMISNTSSKAHRLTPSSSSSSYSNNKPTGSINSGVNNGTGGSKVVNYIQGTYNNYFKEVIQKRIHKTFYDNIVYSASNIHFVIHHIGLFPIVEYLQHLSTSSIHETFPLIQLIAIIISTHISNTDAQILFDYICSTTILLPDHISDIAINPTFSSSDDHASDIVSGDDRESNRRLRIKFDSIIRSGGMREGSEVSDEDEDEEDGDEAKNEELNESNSFQIEVKIQLLNCICSVMATSYHLIDHFSDFFFCFVLLQNKTEALRLFAIQMIGIITSGLSEYHRVKHSRIFSLPFLISTLSSFPFTLRTYRHLIDLMIGQFKFHSSAALPSSSSVSSSISSPSLSPSPNDDHQSSSSSHSNNNNINSNSNSSNSTSMSSASTPSLSQSGGSSMKYQFHLHHHSTTENITVNLLRNSTSAINSSLIFPSSSHLKPDSLIVYPEIIQLILEMISSFSSSSIHHNDKSPRNSFSASNGEEISLQQIQLKFFWQWEGLLHVNDNMNLLWEYPWLDWLEKFLRLYWQRCESSLSSPSLSSSSLIFTDDDNDMLDLQPQPRNDNNHHGGEDKDEDEDTKNDVNYRKYLSKEMKGVIEKIVQKMFNYEISKESMRFMKLKEMYEKPTFQLFILDVIITFFDMNPCLDGRDGYLIINNLTILYRDIENIKSSGRVCMKILNDINLLAYQNTAEIRMKMKETGIFDIRDQLILHFLRGNITEEITREFISSFSFHSIANQQKFRDNFGILYLVQFLSSFSPFSDHVDDSQLRSILHIYHILKNILSPVADNLDIIRNIFPPDIFPKFFENEASEPQSSLSDPKLQRHKVAVFPIAFLNWFYDEQQTQHRDDMSSKIRVIISPLESSISAHDEKVEIYQQWKIKERLEKLEHETEITQQVIRQVNEKVFNHLKTSQDEHQRRILQSYEERASRYLSGAKHYAQFPSYFQ